MAAFSKPYLILWANDWNGQGGNICVRYMSIESARDDANKFLNTGLYRSIDIYTNGENTGPFHSYVVGAFIENIKITRKGIVERNKMLADDLAHAQNRFVEEMKKLEAAQK